MPSPIVFSDVNYLSTTAPQSAAEWSSFLRPLRGREPEGMWNLLSIVREMYKRNDRNSLPLLEIVTLQCLETAQIMIWWFNTKVPIKLNNRYAYNIPRLKGLQTKVNFIKLNQKVQLNCSSYWSVYFVKKNI